MATTEEVHRQERFLTGFAKAGRGVRQSGRRRRRGWSGASSTTTSGTR